MRDQALVLFSGGQDSTTCLAWALVNFARVETVGFRYGQRHAVELDCRPVVIAELRKRFPAWGGLRRLPGMQAPQGRPRALARGARSAAQRLRSESRMYQVKEIFYTLQGEGVNAGRPAVFCRF